ncbi:MAG: hypothetical protein AB2L12_01650 [Smithellaceae bacterium]
MEYSIVLNIIALSILIGLLMTDVQMKEIEGGSSDTNTSKPPGIANASKKCPCCKEVIAADVLRCRHCGSFVDFFKS